MGIELIMTVVMATSVGSGCSWAHPGANPSRGAPTSALADFPMSEDTRRQLRALMEAHRYTDVVTITRDDISGKSRYGDLRMMHSGRGELCHGSVDRSEWSATHQERGLVYCVGETCVIVPTVCNNVSLLSREPDEPPLQSGMADGPIDISPAAGPPAAQEPMTSALADNGPLDFLPAAGIVALPGTGAAGDGGGGGGGGGVSFPTPPTPGGGCCTIGTGTPIVVTPTSAVPELPVWAMLLAGLATLVALRFKRS
jgi:hypothetical protein